MKIERYLSISLLQAAQTARPQIALLDELLPEAREVRGLLVAIGDLYDRSIELAEQRELAGAGK